MTGHWAGAVAEWSGSAADCTQPASGSYSIVHLDDLDDQYEAIESRTSSQITVVGRPTRELTAVAA